MNTNNIIPRLTQSRPERLFCYATH